MWVVADDLRRVLAEVSDLCFEGDALSVLSDLIEIYAILVSERVEDIHVLNCILSSLFVAINEVDPVVDGLGYIPTLQLLPQFRNKQERVIVRPFREYDIIDFYLILCQAITVIILIDEHLRQRINLRDQFSNISGAAGSILPRSTVTIKYSIRAVELPTLEGQCPDAVRSDSDQEVEDDSRGGVMRTEVVLIEQFFLIVVGVFLEELVDALLVAMAADVFGEVSVGLKLVGFVGLELLADVDPR